MKDKYNERRTSTQAWKQLKEHFVLKVKEKPHLLNKTHNLICCKSIEFMEVGNIE